MLVLDVGLREPEGEGVGSEEVVEDEILRSLPAPVSTGLSGTGLGETRVTLL